MRALWDLIALVEAVIRETTEAFPLQSAFGGIVVLFCILEAISRQRVRTHARRRYYDSWSQGRVELWDAISVYIAFCIGAVFIVFLISFWRNAYIWLGQIFLWSTSQVWFIPAAVLEAWVLYQIRIRARVLYGVTEVFVGIAAVTSPVANDPQANLAHLLGIAGGVYIVIRGFDNIENGVKAFERPPFHALSDEVSMLWYRFTLRKIPEDIKSRRARRRFPMLAEKLGNSTE